MTFIKDGADTYLSSNSMKLLGLNFSDSTSMESHVESIKKKVHKRSWTLVNLRRAGVSNKDSLAVYYSLIRSVIEYASITYHSMLTAEQANSLESLQKMCVRIIFGWDQSYSEIRQQNDIELLEARRKKQCLKFAKECTESENFRDWFPLEPEKLHDLRVTNKYAIPKFNFYRYDNSPLNYMRRALNEDHARQANLPLTSRYTS